MASSRDTEHMGKRSGKSKGLQGQVVARGHDGGHDVHRARQMPIGPEDKRLWPKMKPEGFMVESESGETRGGKCQVATGGLIAFRICYE